MSSSLRCGVAFIALLAMATAAHAQGRPTPADLTGVVTDQTGAVLVGATVSATHNETNAVRRATTTDNGRFVLPALQPVTYRLRIEKPGFTTQLLEQIPLTLSAS